MNKKLLILDYGHGNANSIKRSLKDFKINTIYSNSKDEINSADGIILPGVGHFESAMESMKKSGVIEILSKRACIDKIPFLGICLGFQLMANHSEEGSCDGLNWIDTCVKKIQPRDSKKFKVPHIGWRTLGSSDNCTLLKNIDYLAHPFYFCHKFAIDIDLNGRIGTYKYEDEYVGIFEKDNIFGVQFHPEKSHEHGKELIKNFINLI
jgi:glutamine amidotransferase